ncbi:MAG: large conductance mechanosensitive channel protein MscL [Clostridia bacterium]|nr:large conductance mechanosensitive channel protein MscL [Clostridia bacterium]
MEEKVKGIKKFFEEFKKFITRGNVLDMSVGVIVGGAFTGIVNGLSNFILKPIINWLLALVLGKNGLEGVITILSDPVYTAEGALDLANTIYIDWGAFISAIINFLLIAFVLFMIVRTINNITAAHERMVDGWDLDEKKELLKIRREQKLSKKEALVVLEERRAAAKAKKEEEDRIAAEKAAADAAAAEEKAMTNTRLLEEIRDLLKQK